MSQLQYAIKDLTLSLDARQAALTALARFVAIHWDRLAERHQLQAEALANMACDYSLDFETRQLMTRVSSRLRQVGKYCADCHELAESYREQPEPEPAEEPTDSLISAPTEPPPTNPTPEPEETNDDQF